MTNKYEDLKISEENKKKELSDDLNKKQKSIE